MYQLSSQTGVILRLYHLSYITSMAANPEILGLKTVVEKWTGQTKIGETKAVRADSLVGVTEIIQDVRAKKVTVRQKGVLVMVTILHAHQLVMDCLKTSHAKNIWGMLLKFMSMKSSYHIR